MGFFVGLSLLPFGFSATFKEEAWMCAYGKNSFLFPLLVRAGYVVSFFHLKFF